MAEASSPTKKCLYEVLGLARDCTQDEIRAVYKRRALQLHPDKLASSGISPSAATAAFQELVHAYEVLSDPRERSWYDSHRSQIVFSSPPSKPSSKSFSSFFDLNFSSSFSPTAFSSYFSPTAVSDYSYSGLVFHKVYGRRMPKRWNRELNFCNELGLNPDSSGRCFYKVYADRFSILYNRELYFCNQLGLNPEIVRPAPLIGHLESPYSQVSAFYNYWLGFSTVMDFGWVNAYDASEETNRLLRRAMEKEKKKARRKARRNYNNAVRGLAAYAEEKDNRVGDMQIKEWLEHKKRRAEAVAKKKEGKKKKAEQAMMYEEPEWAQIDEEEAELVLGDGYDDGDGYGDKRKKKKEEFYCVVCNKKFNSDRQCKNHEQSKKHRDEVAELRDSFREEWEALMQDGEGDFGEGVRVGFHYVPPSEDQDSDAVDELCEGFKDEVVLEEDREQDGSVKGGDKENLGVEDDEGASSSFQEVAAGSKGGGRVVGKNRKPRNQLVEAQVGKKYVEFESNNSSQGWKQTVETVLSISVLLFCFLLLIFTD